MYLNNTTQNRTATKIAETILSITPLMDEIGANLDSVAILIKNTDYHASGSTMINGKWYEVIINNSQLEAMDKRIYCRSYMYHIIEAIIHELIHVAQYQSGRLTLDDPDRSKPYYDRWYEKEAFELTDLLMSKYGLDKF